MSKQLFPHKILWLASYPKSGNTWFRAFLTALLNNGEVDINRMASDGIFSSRTMFDLVADIDSRDLYDTEAKIMLPDVYRHIAAENNTLSILKVHDAFTTNAEGKDLIPGDVTQCAIYFIRNPLDIAGSLANHFQFSIQEAVDMLNNDDAYMAAQRGNNNRSEQFPQYLSGWSDHVESWTAKPSFPVLVIRYEDMLTNTYETFNKALKFIGWYYDTLAIEKAIAASSFSELKKQEMKSGFKEKTAKGTFFRSGTIGNWEKELTIQQKIDIKIKHKNTLDKFKY